MKQLILASPKADLIRALAAATLLALAACSGGGDNELASLDNDLLANGADPALTSALEDQILVDPELVQQANPNSVRPPETPVQAQYPAGSARAEAAIARMQRAGAEAAASGDQTVTAGPCENRADFDNGLQWASRLPAEFPAYPGARVTEAAGTSHGGCQVRVVTFTTGDPYDRVLQHYQGLAQRAGFSAEHQRRGEDHVLGGVNLRTDGAFYLIVTPQPQGSEVALIVNNGR
jgi:hypothetical protein